MATSTRSAEFRQRNPILIPLPAIPLPVPVVQSGFFHFQAQFRVITTYYDLLRDMASLYFELFRAISTYFDLFRAISTYFDVKKFFP